MMIAITMSNCSPSKTAEFFSKLPLLYIRETLEEIPLSAAQERNLVTYIIKSVKSL